MAKNCQSIFDFLAYLPATLVDELYGTPCACVAVLRSLPPLAKQYVMRLAFVDCPISNASLQKWSNPRFATTHDEAVKVLVDRHVFRKVNTPVGVAYTINKLFQKNLKAFILSGEDNRLNLETDIEESGEEGYRLEDLENFLRLRWEHIILSMVPESGKYTPRSDSMTQLLLQAGLISKVDSSYSITHAGFQFLLHDSHTQLWTVILAYLENHTKTTCISFLFKLGFLKLGMGYSTNTLTPEQRGMLTHLDEFGLIMYKPEMSPLFFPTRIAISLCSTSAVASPAAAPGSTALATSETDGYILVETNFRLYAYTNSSVHRALLCLFSDVVAQLPNLIACVISAESVRRALLNGITANQIVSFLRKNAHPQSRKQRPCVPETVADQILLWEGERNRVRFQPAMQYEGFSSYDLYLQTKVHAAQLGVLLWSNDSGRQLITQESAHPAVKAFIVSAISQPT
eukprot:TRINITY_DN6022_c0_g1_i1.p1 TRINITY_DN6022_c0_g1~~TRINITY_DN6022_c0_g1_i1.p1  ORF type:complete len:467 (+),score=125.65 TRINITY_DN6022_c0_g1_i1:29-1402(+)